AIVDEHDIVYRGLEAPAVKAAPKKPEPGAWRRELVPDAVQLFRYSALTFNGHRIHYDQPYVTGVEGYPGLIVHGPLMGMLQIELARRSNPGKVVESFEFRALSPVFGGAALGVHGRREPDGSIATWIADPTGGLAQQGKATFR
ncbi:MAG: protein dehydratase, partial [Reyranella sp.]|nr:protein dehydratase [Reyranella sp.]